MTKGLTCGLLAVFWWSYALGKYVFVLLCYYYSIEVRTYGTNYLLLRVKPISSSLCDHSFIYSNFMKYIPLLVNYYVYVFTRCCFLMIQL